MLDATTPSGSPSSHLDPNIRKRQRDRERYAQMTPQEKEEKLKKRRQAYKRKKDLNALANVEEPLHATHSGQAEQEIASQDKDSIPNQEKNAPTRMKYRNMGPDQKKAKREQVNANRALRRNTPSKYSIEMESPTYIALDTSPQVLTRLHRKNVAHEERQALVYRQNESFTIRWDTRTSVSLGEDPSICTQTSNSIDPPKEPSITNTGDEDIFDDDTNESDMFDGQAPSSMLDAGTTSFGSPSPLLDPNIRRRQRDRERYAQMTLQEKEEKLKKRREAYKRNKDLNALANVEEPLHATHSGQAEQEIASQDKGSIPKQEKKALARMKYRNMGPDQKKAKIEQVIANRALRRNTPSKYSIAMESPTYIALDTSPQVPTRLHRKHIAHDERQALVSRQNESFTIRWDTRTSVSVGEDPSICTQTANSIDPPKQQSITNTGDEDIFDDDTNEESDMFDGQDWETHKDVEIKEVVEAIPECSSVPDPCELVYSNIPQCTHMLKPVENCQFCNAKKFEHETKGFCCRNGQTRLAHQDTPPELMRLWTSNDSYAQHFRNNIRFFNGHFSFTSLYCHLDRETSDMRKTGFYTFRAHGQMYHNISSFGTNGSDPKHLELYFYDDDPSLEHRYRRCRQELYEQDQEVVNILTNVLRGNPYAEQFRSLGQIENLEDCRVMLNLDQRLDQRTYNVPISSEVAAVWVEGNERRKTFEKSVILHGNNNDIQGIRSYYGCYDPLSYPLFFPKAELGWHADIPKFGVKVEDIMKARQNRNNSDEDPDSGSRLCVSVRDYYCYKFQMRPGIFNPILHGGRLLQQFAVDTYNKIESSRLDYIWNHQKEIRADLYQSLLDSVNTGENKGSAIGKRTVLASSFIGGPRDKLRRYMDAMTLVRKYGKPDIFLTMTCNPNWEEIIHELKFGQTPQDRPDLIVRVFKAKLEEMKKQLFEKGILGIVQAYTYVVEFQKRGLPHAHFLLIMTKKYKYTHSKQYDRVISAELPNQSKEDDIDEIRQYRDARWVTPLEALWRIYGFDLSKVHPSVMQLQLHLPNMHMVKYRGKQDIQEVLNQDGAEKTMLTAYFEANRLNKEADGMLYQDFPEHHTWQTGKKKKFWQKRKRSAILQVGRMVLAHPTEGERYYLRVLLNHVTGATCYEDLRTVDGKILPSFREAAERRGLIEADNTLEECLTEAELLQMPSSLRRLFATILVFCEPSDVRVLWNNHLEAMSEDYRRNCQCPHVVQQMVLINIKDMLRSMGKDIRSFPLPGVDMLHDTTNGVPKEIIEESMIKVDPEDTALCNSLNTEQRAAYDEILATLMLRDMGVNKTARKKRRKGTCRRFSF
ncbi:hypothetical protein OsJ_14407 [Oryza sativa Japonica Group]|uniref:Helitron helicase-like domain-containing protein n=1 Tax=Oryza sativa subsp. japonica TaxID=39947 RepID=B9FEM5_ORYSJ|nr:hypothetical protein OsJ_14407 [Oryza sativa Japonica Group]